MNKLLRYSRQRQDVQVQSYHVATASGESPARSAPSSPGVSHVWLGTTSLGPGMPCPPGPLCHACSATTSSSASEQSNRRGDMHAPVRTPPTAVIADAQPPSSMPPTANGSLAAAPNGHTGESQLSPTPGRTPTGSLQRRFSPMRADPNGTGQPAATPDDTAQEPTEENSAWNHGAIGPAAGGGKTGRVIAKLQADNDRLQRELKAERMYLEQSESENRMYKEAVETLRAENSNLQQAKEVDEGIIKRRDRVIDDIRGELEIERNRRIHAERTARDMMQEKNDAIGSMQAEVTRERDIAKHAASHAEVLQQSHRQLNSEYRTRVESVTKDLNVLHTSRDDEKAKLARLEVIQEQSAHELERAQRTNASMQSLYSAHKEQAQATIRALHAEAEQMRKEYDSIVGRASTLVEEVQWLMRVNKMHEDGTFSKNTKS